MADLTVQNASDEDGTTLTMASAGATGDKFVWDDKAAVIISNESGASIDVTFTAVQTVINDRQFGELTRSNIVKAVAAGAIAIVPPLPAAFRNSADSYKVAMTYSAYASLKVAAFRIE